MKKSKETKNNNVTSKEQSKQCLPLYGGFGIIALFVFASIIYSTVLICLTYADNQKLYIGLLPQVGFAGWLAVYKFSSK